eukprot:scaffold105683_cov27-Tisochrysis_lutea.AAC.3
MRSEHVSARPSAAAASPPSPCSLVASPTRELVMMALAEMEPSAEIAELMWSPEAIERLAESVEREARGERAGDRRRTSRVPLAPARAHRRAAMRRRRPRGAMAGARGREARRNVARKRERALWARGGERGSREGRGYVREREEYGREVCEEIRGDDSKVV